MHHCPPQGHNFLILLYLEIKFQPEFWRGHHHLNHRKWCLNLVVNFHRFLNYKREVMKLFFEGNLSSRNAQDIEYIGGRKPDS